MKRTKIILSIGILIILLSTSISAQKPELIFEKIMDNNEKSIGYITGITQDKIGFIWFTTLNGLYRYDGYQFRIFRNVYNDSTSLPFNSFEHLFIDSKGIIWLVCRDTKDGYNKNILSFNPNIKGYKIENLANINILEPGNMVEDTHNNQWIATSLSGIHRYNLSSKISEIYCKNYLNYESPLYPLIKSTLNADNIVAEINKVTDNQKLKKSFSIDKETPVLILSIGEGDNNSMADFGFITTAKDTLWLMKYSNTRNAGGAVKNRIEIKIDTLKPGNYTLQYVSDDSHSYGAWNEPAPDVLDLYGIQLFKVNYDIISKLQPFLQDVQGKNKISSNNVRDIKIDSTGKLWILTYQGVSEYDYSKGNFIDHGISFSKILKSNDGSEGPKKMNIDNYNIWIITYGKGLLKYNIKNNTYKIYNDTSKQQFGFESISRNKKGQLLLSGYSSLNIFDTANTSFYHFKNNENNIYDGVENFFEDRSGTYWISSYEGLNKATEKKFDYTGLVDLSFHLFLKHTYLDKSNTIWFLKSEKNLFCGYNIPTKSLKEYTLSDKNLLDIAKSNTYSRDWINFIYEDSKNNLWIAVSNGLYNFNRDNGKIAYYVLLNDSVNNTTKNEIVRIYEDSDKNLWVFSYKGIYLYDFINNKLTLHSEFDLFDKSSSSTRINNIDYIFEDVNKTLWLRTYNGLFALDILKKKITRIISFDKEYFDDVHRGNLHTDNENNLWLATFKNLYKINLINKNITTYTIRGTYQKVEWNVGYRYYKISDGQNGLLWISTGYGLVKFDKGTGKVIIFTDKQGLVGNNIQDYEIDKRGMIWLATEEGISRFNPINEIFTYYKETFQLSHDTKPEHQFINRNVLTDGSVLFFTTYGIVTFKPDNFNKNIPPIVITKFSLFENEYLPDTIINLKKQIRLRYNQNFFSFEFAALDFDNPAQNRYLYKLAGVDENWTGCDAKKRIAKYTNVPPGKYIFTVKGSNSDGVWNEKGTSIQIIITPPWYKTIFAYIIYVILLISIIYLYIKFRERKLQKENENLEKQVKERTAEIELQKEEIEAKRKLVTSQKEHIEQIHKEVTDSINYAKRIQTSALPDKKLLTEYFNDLFILFKPKDVVSGDFYWFAKVENQIVLTVADCTGHGVPGAFMSMLGISILKEIVVKEYITQPDIILKRLRKEIIKTLGQTGVSGEQKDGMDISLCSINIDTLEMQWSGANNPCFIIKDGELIKVEADKMPIAIYDKMDKFTLHEIKLQKNDIIYLASDGFADQFGGPDNKKFMSGRFKELIFDISGNPMGIQQEILNKTLDEWEKNNDIKHEQTDDITVMGLKI